MPAGGDEPLGLEPPQQAVQVAQVDLGVGSHHGGNGVEQVVAVAGTFPQEQEQRRLDEALHPGPHRPVAGPDQPPAPGTRPHHDATISLLHVEVKSPVGRTLPVCTAVTRPSTLGPMGWLHGAKGPQRTFWLLCLATLGNFVAQGLLYPGLPLYLTDELGTSKAVAGLVVSSMSLAAIGFRPWAGGFIDRRGRRPLLLAGPLVTALSGVGLLLLAIGAGRAGHAGGAGLRQRHDLLGGGGHGRRPGPRGQAGPLPGPLRHVLLHRLRRRTLAGRAADRVLAASPPCG